MWEKIDVNQHHHSISHPRWGKTQLRWYILILETSLVFSSRLSLPSTVSLTTNFHVLNVVQHVKDIQPLKPKHITSKLKKIPIKVIHSDFSNFMVSSSKLSLLSTVSSTTNSHVLNIVRHVESIFDVKPHHHSLSDPSWRKFQLKWYIILSATSLVFLSMLSLPTTMPSTTNPNEQKVSKWGIQ